MGLAAEKCSRLFVLYVRCSNCLKEGTVPVSVPNEPDAPRDGEELIESAYLGSLRFSCQRCESPIGELVGVGGGELI